jgi:tetratricopeptide (TPR) repeat protein
MLGMEGKTEDSSFFSEKALQLAEKVYGEKHIETARTISKRLGTLYNNKEYATAEKYAFRAIEIFESNSDKSSKYASLLSTLTNVYIDQDKLDLAEEYVEKSKHLLVNIWGEDSFAVAVGPYIQYAHINIKKKDFEQALYYCDKSISIIEQFGGKDHIIMFAAMDAKVEAYLEMEQLDEALQAVDLSLENKLVAFGDEHVGVLTSISMKSTILFRQGFYEEAEKLLSENFEKCKTHLGVEHKLTQTSLQVLVNCYKHLGNTKMEQEYMGMIL